MIGVGKVAGAFTAIFVLLRRLLIFSAQPDITKITLLSNANAFEKEFVLGKRVSVLIGKSSEAYINLEDLEKNHLIANEHAVMNRVRNIWFIERLSDEYSVGLRRVNNQCVYKLKTGVCYRLYANDVLYIANKRLFIT